MTDKSKQPTIETDEKLREEMKNYTETEIKEILEKHDKWLIGNGGKRADLRCADLRYTDLSYADLLKTIFEGINWLAYFGIVPDSRGKARAYKVTTSQGNGVYTDGVNYISAKEFSAELNKDVTQHCASGINLATFAWCLNEKQEGRRLFLMAFKVSPENVCVPVGSDGKFRVAKCTKIGECDWQGNLLATSTGGKDA